MKFPVLSKDLRRRNGPIRARAGVGPKQYLPAWPTAPGGGKISPNRANPAYRAETMTIKLSDELSKNLLELSPDATVVVDGGGTIIFANAQVARTFGYSPSEITGQSVDVLLPERFRGGHTEHRARFALQPRPRAMGEGLTLFGQHKQGHEFPVEISMSPCSVSRRTVASRTAAKTSGPSSLCTGLNDISTGNS